MLRGQGGAMMPFGYHSVIVFDWTASPRLFIFNLGGVPASGEQSVESPPGMDGVRCEERVQSGKAPPGFYKKNNIERP
ncbi:hypothetical protein ACFSHR_11345 [Azotobacter chroococcum]